MSDSIKQESLEYHRSVPYGKLSVQPTKTLANQRDLSLAYSPGVAAACEEIQRYPLEASTLTTRANLVAVITNGTAVLGLGNIGPLAAKPVMEGKSVLFKKFSNIDSFDIEVDSSSVEHFCTVVKALEPTFGAINLEDIGAPDCFEIEERLEREMGIPVFHDDQHGTAIIVGAATHNALLLVEKNIADIRIICSGAGAAATACLRTLVNMGAKPEHISVFDKDGLLTKDRAEGLHPIQARFANATTNISLSEALKGADMFLGLSAAGLLTPEMIMPMAPDPIIFGLANPVPEIMPDLALKTRPDAICASGRSDFPNQINNVLCFPFIFRGALDVGATQITAEMKLACVEAIANLTRKESSEIVANAYLEDNLQFGRTYLIPKPFDPRLITEIAPAVAKAAMRSGVAERPIANMDEYSRRLEAMVNSSATVMKGLFGAAAHAPKRVTLCEGENPRVLRAAQILIDDGLAQPILIGREKVVKAQIKRLGLRMQPGQDFELVDPNHDPRFRAYYTLYHDLTWRSGIPLDDAKTIVRTNTTVIGALMLKRNETEGMICGTTGHFQTHVNEVREIIGLQQSTKDLSTLMLMVMDSGPLFLADTHITYKPSKEELIEMVLMSTEVVKRFGIEPVVSLVSHSNYGSSNHFSAEKTREAVRYLQEHHPEIKVDGECHVDAALDESFREGFPNSLFNSFGSANLLIMPSLDAANISYNLLKTVAGGIPIGPMMIGLSQPAHVITTASTVRGIVNIATVTVTQAQLVAEQSNASPLSIRSKRCVMRPKTSSRLTKQVTMPYSFCSRLAMLPD
ncbi:MAG: NADP-dependent malic enzyme [Alphaproteobacteria bacterium]|nr:NADP-dependent malic enzyme [Alphaproteobacteria bacterium]